MKDRLIGREQEYGMMAVSGSEEKAKQKDLISGAFYMMFPEPPADAGSQIRTIQVQKIIDAVKKSGLPFLKTPGNPNDIWLSNGSRLYLDYGALLEFASPECRVGGLDLIIYEKASERILNKVVRELTDSGMFKELFLYKNNVGPSGDKELFPEVTFGHHQNYSYAPGKEAKISQILKTFIPISLILSGSGHVYRNPDLSWQYIISPRATHIVTEEAHSTTANRPLINSREQPNRFHLISRDATRCELQTWLVDMATHLVMRLAEEDWEMPAGFALVLPVSTLGFSNHSFRDYLNGQSGSWMLPGGIDVLRYNKVFLDAARQLNPLSEEESDALDEWGRIIELLGAKKLNDLVGELDWVTKWNLLSNQMDMHGYGLDDLRAWKLDLSYHDISDNPDQSWFARLDNFGYIRHLIESEDIDSAVTTPPADTRAFSRGRFITFASQHPELSRFIARFDWSSVTITREKEIKNYFFGEKDDPFAPVSRELEKLYLEHPGNFPD